VLLIAQSQTHMQFVAGQRASWWRDARSSCCAAIPIARSSSAAGAATKRALAATLAEALRDCWALVTWSSAAANEALLAGVPCLLPPDPARRRRWRSTT
jgi:hypothetical protein